MKGLIFEEKNSQEHTCVNLSEVIKRRTNEHGITFINSEEDEEYVGYHALYDNALTILSYLQKKGLQPKDELILQVSDNRHLIYAFWACILGGFIAVPLHVGHSSEEQNMLFEVYSRLKHPYIMTTYDQFELIKEACGSKDSSNSNILSKAVFIEEAMASSEQGIEYLVQGQDIAYIQFSSGSTGNPKGVMLSHNNLLTNTKDIYTQGSYTSSMKTLCWLPLTHNFAMIGFHLTSLCKNMNQFLIPTGVIISNPLLWMDKCNEKRIDITYSPTFGFRMFVQKYMKQRSDITWDLSSLKIIYNGAEPVSADVCIQFMKVLEEQKLSQYVVTPAYGLAEASVGVSISNVADELEIYYIDRNTLGIGDKICILESNDPNAITCVSLGEVVDSVSIRICDQNDMLLSEKTVGCIELKGKSVTQGYYLNEQATKEIFTKDGWLKTGDLGFLIDNKLIITGRSKEIIFINGKNFFPSDIEKVGQEAEGVQEGSLLACGIYNITLQIDELILFVIYDKSYKEFIAIAEKIHSYIAMNLGISVTKLIPVKKFERTYSGKVQRFKMIENYRKGLYDDRSYQIDHKSIRKNKNKLEDTILKPTEKKLIDIWREILEVNLIGINDSFFELGGQSVKVVMLVSKINTEFNTKINPGTIFKCKTIAKLAPLLDENKARDSKEIKHVEKSDYYEISSAQKRMYLLSNLKSGGIHYNIPVVMEVPGIIDRDKLKKSFLQLLKNHEGLRTYFRNIDGTIVQCICDQLEGDIDEKYTTDYKDSLTAIREALTVFDLAKPPLIKMTILHESNQKEYILLDMHHIVGDGSSIGIIIKDLIAYYEGRECEEELITYKDFTLWQNKQLVSGPMEEQKKYWINRFSGEIPILNLPYDFKRPAIQDMSGNRIAFNISDERFISFKYMLRKTDSTLYMGLLSILYILLYKLSGQEDLVIGSPIVGRNHPDLKNTVGVFVNTLAMRNNINNQMTYTQFLNTVNENTIAAMNHSDLQYEELVDSLNIHRDMGRNPLFDVMFTLQNMNIPELCIDNMKFIAYELDSEISKFDLTLYAMEVDGHIRCEFEYAKDLFLPNTINKFIEEFYLIMDLILENRDCKIGDISITTRQDKNKQIYELNKTETNYPKDKTIAQLFEEQVLMNNDQVAISIDDKETTYDEINKEANKLAHFLRSKGVKANTIVGMYVERSIEMIVGIFAILKAGGAYLPIDIQSPDQRIRDMVEDSETTIVLVQKETSNQLKDILDNKAIDILEVQFDSYLLQEYQDINPMLINESSDLGYVMYTSGSTGKPKGNLTKQYNITRVVKDTNYISISSEDSLLQLSNYAFDGSTFDIFGALLNGAKLVLVKKDQLLDTKVLAKLIEKQGITVFFVTTALFNTLVDINIECFKNIRKVLFGGERVSVAHVKKAFEYMGSDKIIHVYGPTESTVFTTFYPVNNIDHQLNTIPIGKPISNTEIYVMDEKLNVQPIGVAGELCIAGDGLIDGYLKRKDETNKKFVDSPEFPGKVLYKSGDLVRLLSSNDIEFMDRMDDQVKIRGFRIELAEIENRLLLEEYINEAVVISLKEQNMNLAAYYTADCDINIPEMKERLADTLPLYMIPLYFIKLDKMPLTINGKIDKALLPKPTVSEIEEEYVDVTNELEKQIQIIWSEVLKTERIGLYDNFFDIGGNSLLLMRVHSKLKEQLKIDIKITDIFANPTIYKLGKFIAKNQSVDGDQVKTNLATYILPKEFYRTQKGESTKETINLTINNKLLNQIYKNRYQKDPCDLILAGFVCLMKKLLNEDFVQLCWLNSDKTINCINLKMESQLELDVLLNTIHMDLLHSDCKRKYSISELNPFDHKSTEPSTRILWSNGNEESSYYKLHNHFNMVFRIHEYRNELSVECEFDTSVYRSDKVSEFMALLINITGLLLDEGDK